MPAATTSDPEPRSRKACAPEDRAERDRATRHLLRKRSQATDTAERARLLHRAVELNLAVADEVAAHYHGRGTPTEDLRQIAAMGLVKAALAFRPEPETSFLAFALPTVSGELKRHFRDHAWLVRVPRRLQDLLARIRSTQAELSTELPRRPTPAQVAGRLGIAVSEVTEALAAAGCRRAVPVEALADQATPTDELTTAMERIEDADVVRSLLAGLDPRARTILVLRYGHQQAQAEIGRAVGVSQVQVSREIRRALASVRARLADVA